MKKKPTRVLVTIPMSHYCEKARWGLERLGLSYHEERHLQVFHYPRTYWLSKGPNVPVLIDAGTIVADSTRILQHLDKYADENQRLYPADRALCEEVTALEDRFDEMLGVETRRWVYFHMMKQPVRSLLTAGQGTPLAEKLLGALLYPFLGGWIAYMLNPSAAAVEKGLEQCRQLILQIDARLADGRPYLTGDRFTAADLALACMFAPLVMPRNYGIRLPDPAQLPPAMAEDVARFRDTATGKFVLRLYENDRPAAQQASGEAATAEGHGKLPGQV